MPYACIFVPDFPAQAILRAEPELRDYALVVLDGRSPVQRPIAMNEYARRKGVQTGMPKTLLEQCPSLLLRPRSPSLEVLAHQALLKVGKSFSPRVEELSSDVLMMDLAGMGKLFGRPEELAGELARRLKETGLEARIAVASNSDAALAAARGKAGITVIPTGREAEVLGPLPLAVLDPPAEILGTLERWGIRDFYGLAALPTAELSERLGQPGVQLQALARGQSLRPLIGSEPPPEFIAHLEIEYPVEELEPLAFLLNRLLGDLCDRLNTYSAAAQQIDLHLDLEADAGVDVAPGFGPAPKVSIFSLAPLGERGDRKAVGEGVGAKLRLPIKLLGCAKEVGAVREPPLRPLPSSDEEGYPSADGRGSAEQERHKLARLTYEKCLPLPVPTRDPKLLLNLLRLQLETDPPSAPILKVGLKATPAPPRVAQGGLFVPQAPDPEKFEITLARIAGLVGPQNVGSPRLLDSHRPGTFEMRPFTFLPPSVAPGFSPAHADFLMNSFPPNRESARSALDCGREAAAFVRARHDVPVHGGGQDVENERKAVAAATALPSRRLRPGEQEFPQAYPQRVALRIYRPPVPASVSLRNDVPDQLSFRGIRGRVVMAGGPWRTSGCWWQSEAWQYDEWDLEMETSGSGVAGFYLIYLDRAIEKWFVRGEYD